MLVTDIKSLILKLNQVSSSALQQAASFCVNKRNYEIKIEHFLIKTLEEKDSDIEMVFNHFDLDIEIFKKELNREIEKFDIGSSSRPTFAPKLIELFQDSWTKSTIDFEQNKIRTGLVLLTLLDRAYYYFDTNYNGILKKLNKTTLDDEFFAIVRKSSERTIVTNDSEDEKIDSKEFISKYCNDVTQKAKNGKIDAVFGRDNEIRVMIDILARRRKNNPILVGEPGVGKSALVEGLALKIINDDVPPILKGVSILELDLTLLQAGAGMKGEFENRLKGVITEIQNSTNPIILFIDEAHTLIGAGGNSGTEDAANLLKPMLARGELRTIAATTWGEYKKYFEKDAALARRFQLVKIDEPSVENSILILRGIKKYYESSHNIDIQDEAIVASAKLSNKYIMGRFLPDKAIDLLDTACARIKINLNAKPSELENKEQELRAIIRENESLGLDLKYGLQIDSDKIASNEVLIQKLEKEIEITTNHWNKELEIAKEIIKLKEEINNNLSNEDKLEELKNSLKDKKKEFDELKKDFNLLDIDVNADIIAKVVSDWTGVPLGKMLRDESETILQLDKKLKEKIIGQELALDKISEVIRASKTGIKNPEQPMGVFLLLGTSGIGKTQTAIELADLIFNNKKAITTINMGEFQEKHSVSRLIGSPPGYVGYGEGGMLSEAVRKKPYSVVLLDEVEKAHPDILNIFYQVFDKGILVDGEGKEINFKDTLIIMTSNLGSDILEDYSFLDENKHIDIEKLNELLNPSLLKVFKQALLARIEVLPYLPLRRDSLKTICKNKLNELKVRISNNNIKLLYNDNIIDTLISSIFEKNNGVRDLEKIISNKLIPEVSKLILNNMDEKNKPISEVEIKIDKNKGLIFKSK